MQGSKATEIQGCGVEVLESRNIVKEAERIKGNQAGSR